MLQGFFQICFFKIHHILKKNYQKASYLNIIFMEVVNTKQDFEIVLLFRLTSNQIWLIPFIDHQFAYLKKLGKKTLVSQHFYCKVLQKIMASIFMLCMVLQYMCVLNTPISFSIQCFELKCMKRKKKSMYFHCIYIFQFLG